MEEADILIHGCTILPMTNPMVITKGTLAIRDGRIVFVGDDKDPTRFRADVKIDGKGKVALPGLVNCHTHVAMTLLRGFADDQPLDTWLRKHVWPAEARLKPEDVHVGAVLGCLEMIRDGTTCFADMYFFEDAVARAARESGLRAALAEGIMEVGGRAVGERMLSRSVAFVRRFDGYAEGRVTAVLGPHAAFSCSPELLSRVSEEASRLKANVHIHVAESEQSFRSLESGCPMSEVEFLRETGLLNSRVLAAHCVNLSDSDMLTLSECKASVAHVPFSNMKLGSGIARVGDLKKLGLAVGLGTDGPASNNGLDMFETMKLASLLQKYSSCDPTALPAYDVLRMATLGGAEAVGLERDVGSLETGKKADVILVDFEKPHLKPLHDLFSSLVYSAKPSDVDTVIVDGRILMEETQVRSLDEHEVMRTAAKTASDLTRA